MKILVSVSSLILLLTIELTTQWTTYQEGINFAYFERISCLSYLPQKVSNVTCRIKYIDRNHVRGYLSLNLRQPTNAVWIHGVGYYKYFTYQKIATEYWDDLCAWANGERKSFLLDFLKPIIGNYTNFNHSCPYTGQVFGKVDNISVQKFTIPQIMPAGRYKIELNATEGDRKTALIGVTLFFSISDHRIEVA